MAAPQSNGRKAIHREAGPPLQISYGSNRGMYFQLCTCGYRTPLQPLPRYTRMPMMQHLRDMARQATDEI